MRYRNLILAVLIVLVLPSQAVAQNAASLQKSTDITGSELLKKLHSDYSEHNWAVAYITGIYTRHFNNGVIPGLDKREHFADIVDYYVYTLNGKLDVPAQTLVIEAIKSAPALIDAQKRLWTNAYKAAEVYFAQPSLLNAEKFCTALPNRRIPTLDDNGETRFQDLVFDFIAPAHGPYDTPPPTLRKNFSTIERDMDKGDPYAVEIMFRLYYFSDGAVAETICFVLGKLMSTHPHLFLQKLVGHEANLDGDDINSIVCMVSELGEIPEAGDDPVKFKQIYDERIMRRIKALESIDDPDLREIRDRCLARLKAEKLL